MSDNTSIESRFEGHEIVEAGIAQIPNLLLMHYQDLGLSDGQYTLLSHIIARKWTAGAPFPSITGIRMSANTETRRRYVRDLRRRGLLFTSRLYWKKEDAEKFPQAHPGKVRSNLWYLGSLLHNLVRIHKWLEAGNKAEDFQVEIPLKTVKMFLEEELHDTPPEIAQTIQEQTRDRTVIKAVLVCENRVVDNSTIRFSSTRKASTRKASTRKTHSHEEESVSNKNNSLNKNQAAAVAPKQVQNEAAAAELISEEKSLEPVIIQENGTLPQANGQKGTGNPTFTAICRLYRQEIGEVSPFIEKEISTRLETCPAEWFELAIGKAVEAESRRWRYVKSILVAWEACGGPENDHKPGKNGARNGKTTNQPASNLNPANPNDWQAMLKSVANKSGVDRPPG